MNVVEYVSQAKTPLNSANYSDTDAAVFSLMSYVRFEDLNVDHSLPMTIGRLMEDYLNSGAAANREIAQALKDSPRYKNLQITGFSSSFDVTKTEQFAGLTVALPGGGHAVVFRGTEPAPWLGWAEDALLIGREDTAAQRSAVEYLRQMAEKYPEGDIFLAGHSKGGALANSASMDAPSEVWDRIVRVVNFDGPGLSDGAMADRQEAYSELKDRMQTYAPKDSLIGQLQTDHERQVFVDSSGVLFGQHSLDTWEIDENGNFVAVEQSGLSIYVNNVLDETLRRLPPEQREAAAKGIIAVLAKGSVDGREMFKDCNDDLEDKRYLDFLADLADSFHDMSLEEQEAVVTALTTLVVVAGEEAWEKMKGIPVIGDALAWGEEVIDKTFDNVDKWLSNIPGYTKVKTFVREARDWCHRKVGEVIRGLHRLAYNALHPYRNFDPGDVISLDTRYLENIVGRLHAIQNRIVQIDRDMDQLRRDQEWYEIANKAVIGAVDFLAVGYDRGVRDIIHYLETVILHFETYDRQLQQIAGQF